MQPIDLTYEPSRNGSATVIFTAKRGDRVLLVEKIDLSRSTSRKRFLDNLSRKDCTVDRAAVDRQLLDLAAEITTAEPEPDATTGGAEVDASRVYRPFLFFAPEVCGVAVPVTSAAGERLTRRWEWYLQWADGRRERRSAAGFLDVPDGGRLWYYPQDPGEPPATAAAGWSAESRAAWLRGDPAGSAADVFRCLCERFAYYIDLPPSDGAGALATLALWSMFSFTYTAWETAPYLLLRGPAGSGKSRVLECLSRVTFRALSCASLSGPSLFRILHAQGGTVLLDEAEGLRNGLRDPGTAELLSALLSGYRRDGAAVRLEAFGETFQPVSFSTHSPKALAAIGAVPEALATRAVGLTMRRSPQGSPRPTRRLDEHPGAWQELRDGLYCWALSQGPAILDLTRDAEPPEGLQARDAEKWSPLLALAGHVEAAGVDGLAAMLADFARENAEAGRDEGIADQDEILLRLLAEARAALDQPQARDLLARAQEQEPGMFKGWSAKGVSNALKRYGVTTNKSLGRRVYGQVTLGELREIETSYGLMLGLPGEPAE